MKRINPHAVGLVFGSFLALWHAVWSVLVLIGAAQPITDFIFRLHMITPPWQIGPFQLGMAVGLVTVTAIIGYVSGFIAGSLWNWYTGTREPQA